MSNTRELVYQFIVSYKAEHGGNSPTLDEIRVGLELSSKSVVRYHLLNLEIDGRIRRPHDGRARSIVVVEHE